MARHTERFRKRSSSGMPVCDRWSEGENALVPFPLSPGGERASPAMPAVRGHLASTVTFASNSTLTHPTRFLSTSGESEAAGEAKRLEQRTIAPTLTRNNSQVSDPRPSGKL